MPDRFIRTAVAADAERCLAALTLTFSGDPPCRWAWPDPQQYPEAFPFCSSIRRRFRRVFAVGRTTGSASRSAADHPLFRYPRSSGKLPGECVSSGGSNYLPARVGTLLGVGRRTDYECRPSVRGERPSASFSRNRLLGFSSKRNGIRSDLYLPSDKRGFRQQVCGNLL